MSLEIGSRQIARTLSKRPQHTRKQSNAINSVQGECVEYLSIKPQSGGRLVYSLKDR